MNQLLVRLSSFSVAHFIVVGVFVAAGVHFLKLSEHADAQSKIDGIQAEILQLETQLQKGQGLSLEKPKYEKEIADTKNVLEAAVELIPTPHSQKEIIGILSDRARIAAVRLPMLKPGPPFQKTGAYYSSLTYELEIEGDYTQITNYFYELSKIKNILHVLDITLTNKQRTDGKAILSCKALVAAFVYSNKLAGAGGSK